MEKYDVVIIGAGPAGLSAGYELQNSGKKTLILEKKYQVGGLAETKVFGKYRYDIGPHRFFTKNKEVYDLFLKILAEDAVEVKRKTRMGGTKSNAEKERGSKTSTRKIEGTKETK